jgi:F-type H+-transporting ATPase subunit b
MKPGLRWSAVFSLFFFALMALPAGAAEGGDETTTPLGWTFRWIHFAIVFGLIAYLLVKKAPAYFRGRAESIASAIAEASRAGAEAERRKTEAAAKLAGLEKELAEMRAAARRDGSAEAERIRSGAREEVGKVERAAQAEIAAAARAARSELKALAARLAVTRAQAQLEKQMTPASEGAIFRSFVQQLAVGGAPGSRN